MAAKQITALQRTPLFGCHDRDECLTRRAHLKQIEAEAQAIVERGVYERCGHRDSKRARQVVLAALVRASMHSQIPIWVDERSKTLPTQLHCCASYRASCISGLQFRGARPL